MYEYICAYMGLRPAQMEPQQLIETAVDLVHLCAKYSELKNELYMQLIKQSRHVQLDEHKQRIWELWLIAGSLFDPAKVLT